MNLQKLNCLSLSFDFLEHLCIDDLLKVGRPVILGLFVAIIRSTICIVLDHHSVEKYLYDNEQVLMCEEHQVFERCIDACLRGCVDIRTGMSQQVKELNEASNGKCFKFLSTQQSLPQMHVLDNLQGDQLRHMHRIVRLVALRQVPPILAQEGRVLARLQRLWWLTLKTSSFTYLKDLL